MRSVRINKEELLSKVRINRDNHKHTFEKALIGYREEVIKELEESLHNARIGKKIQTYISLEEPMNQTQDYDRVIAMLEMSEDQIIELTSQEFDHYVLDNWTWKEQFTISNSKYIK